MTVKLRLARFGRRNAPFYNIVVAHARSRRDGRPLEVIGTYDPKPKVDPYQTRGKLHKAIQLDIDRAKYWVGVGAQPTDTVWRLLSLLGILEPKYSVGSPPTWKRKAKPNIAKGSSGEPVMPPRPEQQNAGRP
ncbi:hypothetical protein MKZ38_005480 [Zalerion maritima]|uniref:Ribosomal protein S16 n=1 Tax=Zalerion maritima TaxID=339359 RepID=A0AAD5WQY8_9PEZI|nr:hypothetical protein MKZ38_005480 [Zalerion maritima]